MLNAILLKGLIVGFSIAAPVGPIGLLTINRTLRYGFRIGLATGLGAALADGIYGSIAAFGLTFITRQLFAHQFWIRMIGGSFLIYLGCKIFLTGSPNQEAEKSTTSNYIKNFGSAFLLTLTNPLTILSFIGIFAGLGLGTQHTHYFDSIVLIIGVICGSLIWWIILSLCVAYVIRKRLSNTANIFINRFSGVVITIMGIIAIYSCFTMGMGN